MPATQRGQVDRIAAGKWRLRWYDLDGKRHAKQPFSSKSAAWKHFREHVEPLLTGGTPPRPELTLSEFIALYLDRHAADVRPRTIATLRERLGHAERRFGALPLHELEGMTDEIVAWRTRQPARIAHGRMSALRQCLAAAVRWGYMTRNPAVLAGRNRRPAPRTIRAFSMGELEAISVELSPQYRSVPLFAAATGLRPEEWQALERRDIDRAAGVLGVRRTISSGKVVELGKTSRSRRQVPLSPRALAALDALPARLGTPLLWPSPTGGLLCLDNWRSREWSPAVEAAGVRRPARIYDLRSTFASNALAAGVSAFELARIMGTSVAMIELHYGSLLDGAAAGIAARLGAFEATS
ncbi:MAG: tyrosine-type recombinase/integrase [Solirubrobacterales bacterium]|nr:tyrosine-type recombinase/integrase [Solirubrobacterales bacterium]